MTSWTFVTNHGAVLTLIAHHGRITARSIASSLGITERSVSRIITDLEGAGYIRRTRVGRANQYEVNRDAPLRRPEARDVAVGELITILDHTTQSASQPSRASRAVQNSPSQADPQKGRRDRV